jgi:Putative amidoligase enzyme
MVDKTIQQLYIALDIATLMFPDTIYAEGPTKMPAPDLIVGVELEIENWSGSGRAIQGWNYTEDGSLRNDGRELVSTPIKTKFLEHHLDKVWATHGISGDNYSERCSTHVHVNVLPFSLNQLKVLCLIYQIVERLLFRWVANGREESIFCVPWYQSGVTPRLVDKMARNSDSTIAGWVKYTALNLLPVMNQGTVEFRHLHGTCDTQTILQWVKLISRMVMYAEKHTLKEVSKMVLEMNTVSNYEMFLADVFDEDAQVFLINPDYREVLSIGVIDAKMMLMAPKKNTRKSDFAWMDELPPAPLVRRPPPRARPAAVPGETVGDRLLREARENLAGQQAQNNWIIQNNGINPFFVADGPQVQEEQLAAQNRQVFNQARMAALAEHLGNNRPDVDEVREDEEGEF